MQTLSLQPAVNARPAGALDETLAQATLRRIEAKEFVFIEGDSTTHVFRVETGAVALYKVLADGRRQVVGFAYPGDLIGLGAQGEHVMNAQAIKPTRLRCLGMTALHRSAAQDPDLAFKLYEALADHRTAQRNRARGELPPRRLAPSGAQRTGPLRFRAAYDARRYRRLPRADH